MTHYISVEILAYKSDHHMTALARHCHTTFSTGKINLEQWARVSMFPSYSSWKRILNSKLFAIDRSRIGSMALSHTSPCTYSLILKNLVPAKFWSLSSLFPDLVPKFGTQIRLFGSFGLQGSVPWIKDLSEALCPLCKAEVEDNIHFFFSAIHL